jgi:hypothetical protein
MTGRLIETRNAKPAGGISIGDAYPAGVYNVVISQGDEVKTLRMIKR